MRIQHQRLVSILGAGVILLTAASLLEATQYNGAVRAADQPVPGAMVTARQGDSRIITYTDENGRYGMDLPPGTWDISVEMFEFTTTTGKVTIGDAPTRGEWVLEMPKLRERLEAPKQLTPVTRRRPELSTPLAPLGKPVLRRVEAGVAEVAGAAADVEARADLARHGAVGVVRLARPGELE